MAAMNPIPAYTQVGVRLHIVPKAITKTESFRLILGLHRVLVNLACPRHHWSWPRSIHGERRGEFDAHQTCSKCTTERFFSTRLWQAGPMYRQSTAVSTERRGSRVAWWQRQLKLNA